MIERKNIFKLSQNGVGERVHEQVTRGGAGHTRRGAAQIAPHAGTPPGRQAEGGGADRLLHAAVPVPSRGQAPRSVLHAYMHHTHAHINTHTHSTSPTPRTSNKVSTARRHAHSLTYTHQHVFIDTHRKDRVTDRYAD